MSSPVMSVGRPVADHAPLGPLRTALRVDGYSTALFGVVLLAGAPWLRDPLGLPVAWSVPFGVAMLGGSAALTLIAGHPRITRLAGAAVVGNALSCALLLVLACVDVVPLTGLGRAFMVVGAIAVAVFARFEFVGLRRSAPTDS
ncbi:hypothetical protein ABZX93_11560 [Streptomyces sp. NPDC006632]|uniref:hypothetical protein n=1 Tax=Streptomyces sp. NPDC006632 TaxID=3157182 RepID=UPI0033AE9AF8